MTMLTPVLALVVWTLIIWCWMYATRIPAMQKAKVHPQSALHAGALDALPTEARVVADNHNHLHEQPTIFYALAVYSYLVGVGDPLNMWLAWGYVGLRVAHSFAQIVARKVLLRFYMFSASTIILMVIALRNVFALLAV
ncbi:MAPEG family protein [Hyphococcus sp.]|uniref:MAPEG family protein n=1 Tax=Hyphococcus sp. TaxID=2038636 RepID=UPI002086DB3B|nr:MAG: membrane protein [Marinicaulis sp.]